MILNVDAVSEGADMSMGLHFLVTVRGVAARRVEVAAAVNAVLKKELGEEIAGPVSNRGELAWASDPRFPVIISGAARWTDALERTLKKAARPGKVTLLALADEERRDFRDVLERMRRVRRGKVLSLEPKPPAARARSAIGWISSGSSIVPRVFHFKKGSSRKSWSVGVMRNYLSISFGRIGKIGQGKMIKFPTQELAVAEAEKRIAEKLANGYVEVA